MNVLDKWLAAHGEELIAIRRDLHAHPEIGFDEHRTTRMIAERLRGLSLVPVVPTGGTGVLCDIGTDGPLIALRADIDALPIDDAKDVPYRSTNPGACHACGHDAHTTILLGAAAVLAGMDLPGRIRLIFQPAEERIPGGALGLIAAGAMKEVEAIFALHCDPRVDVGDGGGAAARRCAARLPRHPRPVRRTDVRGSEGPAHVRCRRNDWNRAMKVVILCGGLGTRLRQETGLRRKPMVDTGGRPRLPE